MVWRFCLFVFWPGRSLQAKVSAHIGVIYVKKDPQCATFTRADVNVYLSRRDVSLASKPCHSCSAVGWADWVQIRAC